MVDDDGRKSPRPQSRTIANVAPLPKEQVADFPAQPDTAERHAVNPERSLDQDRTLASAHAQTRRLTLQGAPPNLGSQKVSCWPPTYILQPQSTPKEESPPRHPVMETTSSV